MDEYEFPHDDAEGAAGWTTVLTILAAALSLFVCLLSLSEAAQIGPDVGEIVSFDPRNGPRYWTQPGIPALYARTDDRGRDAPPGSCTLMPPVMAANGGSFVIEAKETSRPPSYRVHWSGPHTDLGAHDCGQSADLILQLVQVRALATVAGGYGPGHVSGLF
jgi:hypothetical protein